MSDDCSVCDDASILQNAACHEKDFRWHVLKTLCFITEYLAAEQPIVDSQEVTNAGIFAVQATVVDGGDVTLGSQADARSTATDTTPVTVMQVLKEISYMLQNPAVLPANQSVNLTQLKGVALSVSNGVTDSGTQRVTISNDSSGQVSLAAGAQIIGSLAANQSINISQVAGGTAINSGVTGSQAVGGNTAHDAVDAGFPTKVGFQARSTLPTAVASADRVNSIADLFGRQVNLLGTIPELLKIQSTTINSSTAVTPFISAGAAGIKNSLVSLHVSNKSATGTTLQIADRNGGGESISLNYWIPPGFNGFLFNQPGEPYKQITAAFNWTAQCGTSVDSIYINASYEQST